MRRARFALAAVALLGAGALAACGDDDDAADAASEIEGVEEIPIGPYEHTQAPVEYDRLPPAGGDHGSDAVPCQFFDQELRQEPAVHSLEHGGVWLAYAPDLDDDDLATIEALTEDYEDVFASPYPDLEDGEAVVATSWGAQLRLDDVDDPRLEAFVDAYRNRDIAPEARIGCA